MDQNYSYSVRDDDEWQRSYCVEYSGKRATYPESMKFIIGRSTTSEFVISSQRVSAQHCEVIRSKDGWQLHNLTAISFGTLLNGKILTLDETLPLEDEAIMKVGDVYIQCRTDIEYEQSKFPIPVLKIQALFGEECCSFSPETEINACSHPMNQDSLNEDVSIIAILPESGSQEDISIEHDAMSFAKKRERRLMKELQEARDAVKKAWICNSKLRRELSEKDKLAWRATSPTRFYDCMEQELQCSICNELISGPISLECTHVFCEVCLQEWKKKSKICPLCRKPITSEHKLRIIDGLIDRVMPYFSEELQNKRNELVASRKAIKRPAPERKRVAKRRRTRGRPVVRLSVDNAEILNDTIEISDEEH